MQFLLLEHQGKERRAQGLLNLEFVQVFHPKPLLRPLELFVTLLHEGFEILEPVDFEEVRDVAGDLGIQAWAEGRALECLLMRFEQQCLRSG